MTEAGGTVKLGTRASPLALAQAREAAARIATAHGWAGDAVQIVPIRTTGDAIQDRPLAEAGGKGLFTRELDRALLDGAIDLAIHSAKDLPTAVPEGLVLAGCFVREDVRDALIAPEARSVEALRPGAVVGTASLRRQAQLLRLRPDLTVKLLRGNVETRLRKVAEGQYDATLLALAGLNRLGLAHHATAILDIQAFLPAVGQGAIAIVARAADAAALEMVAPATDRATTVALTCERAFLTVLDGSCRTPIAGHARLHASDLEFRGLVLAPDGSEAVETMSTGGSEDAAELGADAAHALLARSSAAILSRFDAGS